MNRFSPQLVSKYQEYMFRKHNFVISEPEAQLNLESLADLHKLIMIKESN